DDAHEEGHSGDDGDDIVHKMEEEEMKREGDGGPSKVRRPVWINPYEGKLESKEFPGGGGGSGQTSRYCLNMERRILLYVYTMTI
ncbi:hypothetical protein A2U01_0083640, partial [Trifolium medium]|nr:hypothetical protein [Trifolium medium]